MSPQDRTPKYRQKEELPWWWCCFKHVCPFWWYFPGGTYLFDYGTDEDTIDIIGETAYMYFLIPNVWAFFGAISVVIFQIILFTMMYLDIKDVDESDLGGDAKVAGLLSASLLLFLGVSPSLGKGVELMWKGLGKQPLLIWVGLVEFSIAAMSVWIGIMTALNTSKSVTEVIVNVTVATFINGVDEEMFTFLKYYSKPAWYREAKERVNDAYGSSASPGALDEGEILDIKLLLKSPSVQEKINQIKDEEERRASL